ncbi:MAG: CDP-alcohol phosphatidyltransferase family protein [Clostridiales bacterium]|nr:CDP-alcohol phosphatidyltransferase family protein [Clostridiales bacterium]
MANILSSCRILGSVILLFFPAYSAAFYITYLLCGLSDMIDGTVARKTNSTSEFGSRLDAAADLMFAAVSIIKWLPKFHLPWWLWAWGGIIAMIKIGNLILGYVLKKKFISLHTIMNKATGLLLFLLPLTISFAELKYTATVVCAMATFSAVQEGLYVIADHKCGESKPYLSS